MRGVPVGQEEGRAEKGHRTPCAKARGTKWHGIGCGVRGAGVRKSLLEHRCPGKLG